MWFLINEYYFFDRGEFAAARMGLCAGRTGGWRTDHDTLWRAKALVPAQFFGFVPARHPALRYGIALNDAGYFWESQEVLEAVWAAAPQGGRERILLRACIQIANANLKLRMQKPHATARLSARRWRRSRTCWREGPPLPATALPIAFRRPHLARLLEAKLAPARIVEVRLDCDRVDRRNMKENAYFLVAKLPRPQP